MNRTIVDASSAAADAAPAGHAAPAPAPQLSDPERAALRAIADVRDVPAGCTLVRRGERGHDMYIVESGRVGLDFGGDMPDKELGSGAFFGELALFVDDHERMARVFTLEPSRLLAVRRAAFEALLAREPALMAGFMRRSLAYLVHSERELIGGLRRRNEDLMRALDSLHQTRGQLSLAHGQVRTDELTGLCNRRGLYAYLEQIPEVAQAPVLALLLIDLDRFKDINDRCGHLAGDEALCAVGDALRDGAADHDLPCRLGGDEFALIAHVPTLAALRARAARIADSVRSLRLDRPGAPLRVTVSVGAGVCRRESNWSVWYSEVDRALYHVKGAGGDGFHMLGEDA